MKKVPILTCLLILAGCALMHHQEDATAELEALRLAGESVEATDSLRAALAANLQCTPGEQTEVETRLAQVLAYCEPTIKRFETTSRLEARNAFWLAISGVVAGSVAVPVLTAASATGNAALISGLGGWAGATNVAGNALRQTGLSGAETAQRRNIIVESLNADIAVAIDGSKACNERFAAVVHARSDCVLYKISIPSVSDRPKN